MSGVEIIISTSISPSDFTFVARSLPPTISAPAFSASERASPPANTPILTSLPVPAGSETVVLIFSSASFVSIPKTNTASIDSSNLVLAIDLLIEIASSLLTGSTGTLSISALYLLFFIILLLVQTTSSPKIFLTIYCYPHRSCSTSNNIHC